MKKIITICLTLFYALLYSQNNVEIFTPNDIYYEGGYNQLFVEMVEIAKKENFQPCSSEEIYSPSILIEKMRVLNG